MQANLHTSSQPNYCGVFNMDQAGKPVAVKSDPLNSQKSPANATLAGTAATPRGLENSALPLTSLSEAVQRQGITPDTVSEVQNVGTSALEAESSKVAAPNQGMPQTLVAAVDQLLVVMQSFLTALGSLLSATWDVIKEVLKVPGNEVKPPGDGGATPLPDPTLPGNGLPNMITSELASDWEKNAGSYLVPGATGLISESQVQEGIVAFQVASISDDAKSAYQEKIAQIRQESSGTQTILKRTLSSLVAAKILTQQQAVSIYSSSHRAAQLDERTGAISTTQREGKELSAAIRISTENMKQIASGQIEVPERGIE